VKSIPFFALPLIVLLGSTDVRAFGVVLHTGTVEWRWSLDPDADFSMWTVAPIVTSPPAQWTWNTGSSQWISVGQDGLLNGSPVPSNVPVYFGVEYFNRFDTRVSGTFWADDIVVDVILSGRSQGISSDPPPSSYAGFGTHLWTETPGRGNNFLVFKVLNTGGSQIGLATEAWALIPEPGTMSLMGVLVLGAAAIGRRRSRKHRQHAAYDAALRAL
jgi:hypothetical protein